MSGHGEDEAIGTFWEHLDALRGSLIRAVAVTVVCALAAFFFKDTLFEVVLAPKNHDFITYRVPAMLGRWLGMEVMTPEDFSVRLINTGLTQQFLIHMKTALCAGLLCASPYILYLLFHFVSPALYTRERHYALRTVGSGYVMFLLGAAVNYFVVFPLAFRFLGTYQVSAEVENTITLESYMDTLLTMTLSMGIVFEIPVVCWALARFGWLTSAIMSRFRRHAIVLILVVAAIITPTTDVFTLLLVSLPMWLLYEMSIGIVRRTEKRE